MNNSKVFWGQSIGDMQSVSMSLIRLFILIIFLATCVKGKPTQVLYMSENGEYNVPGFFKKTVTDFRVKNYSICAWLKLDNIRQTNSPVIVYSDDDYLTARNVVFYRLEYDTTIEISPFYWIIVDDLGEIEKGHEFEWILDRWFHFCQLVEFHPSINETHGETSFGTYIDGEVVFEGKQNTYREIEKKNFAKLKAMI